MRIIKKDRNVLDFLRENKVPIDAVCNGKGTCGRCKVKFIDAAPTSTSEEKETLTVAEIDAGIRLACRHTVAQDTAIQLLDEGEYTILGSSSTHFHVEHKDDLLRIAIDIGTTTVVLLVIDSDGKVLDEIRFLNPQRSYGADVLSRIQYTLETDPNKVSDVLLAQLSKTLSRISLSYPKRTFRIGVTGNPTMTHLFMRADVGPIIHIPYSCAIKLTQTFLISNLFPTLTMLGEIVVYPPISAYVGADIVCGLIDLDFFFRTGNHLFLDLGTNGELVLLKDGIAYATSTAAGPAFEGGNLSCGCGSVDGAISDVFRNRDGTLGYATIHDMDPVGICGSGYIDLFSVILGKEMDEAGYLEAQVELTPILGLTQLDVRNFQLAKSAIRSGIEILLKMSDTKPEEIERFDLAGGFGSALSIDAAIKIGLFPGELKHKVHIVGNTALRGAAKLLFAASETTLFDPTRIVSVELASDPALMELFTEYLYFN